MTNESFSAPVKPQVITWFKVYCGFLCFIYLAVSAASLIFFLAPEKELEMSPLEARMMGTLLLLSGMLFFTAFLVPFLVSPRPWMWTYDLVVICVGMTSACFLPVCIPLLIFWLKPETKRYFGKS